MQIVLTPQMVGVTIHDLQVASLIKLQIRPFTLYSIPNRPVLFFYQNTKAFCLPVLPAKLFTKDLFYLVLGMTIKFVQDKFINVSTIISNRLFLTFNLTQKILNSNSNGIDVKDLFVSLFQKCSNFQGYIFTI